MSIDSIPLKEALFCPSCENLVRSRNGCPVCGSKNLVRVESWLRWPSSPLSNRTNLSTDPKRVQRDD